MRTPRWISNLASAESTLSHVLPDTMGSQVDYDEPEDAETLEAKAGLNQDAKTQAPEEQH